MVSGLPWLPAQPLPPRDFAVLRQRAIFDCCKWDPQVEDVATLAAFPLVLEPAAWALLGELAESLAREAAAAEAELLGRPELFGELGLPRAVRRALRRTGGQGTPRGCARLVRFDFHLTAEGWRISEANSDVPGGLNEASGFARLMAEHHPGCALPGDPAGGYAAAVVAAAGSGAKIALAHATAYSDDHQAMCFLARELERRGARTCKLSPAHLRWTAGAAHIACDWDRGPADAVVRFFPAEWLPNLGAGSGWEHFFAGSRTPLSNPGTALLTQSKRFPLVWMELDADLTTWRALLPETRDPRRLDTAGGDWVLKSALGRVGDGVGIPGVSDVREWKEVERSSRRGPAEWAAQRRFAALPLETADGPVYPCIGVYTVDGRAVGAYGRVARRPLIDHRAQDVAVLVAAATADARTGESQA